MDSIFKYSNGDKVTDKVSGFHGTIVGRADRIDGYVQYEVQPVLDHEGKFQESRWFAEDCLTQIE
jgi:hypothetical protein